MCVVLGCSASRVMLVELGLFYSVLCYLLTSLHLNKAKQIDITLFPLHSSFNKGSYQMIVIFCVFESECIEMVTIQG